MSVKSQLNASRDFILTGMRAAARVQTQNPNATKILRGCLDLIETLERQPAENLTVQDLETTLNCTIKPVSIAPSAPSLIRFFMALITYTLWSNS